jgi:hypothetical protein
VFFCVGERERESPMIKRQIRKQLKKPKNEGDRYRSRKWGRSWLKMREMVAGTGEPHSAVNWSEMKGLFHNEGLLKTENGRNVTIMQSVLLCIMELGLRCSEELPDERVDIKDLLVKLQKIKPTLFENRNRSV